MANENNAQLAAYCGLFCGDRKENLQGIKEMGIKQWAEERAASGKK